MFFNSIYELAILLSVYTVDIDGIEVVISLDDDNDKISNLIESGQDYTAADTNNNGVIDSTDCRNKIINLK